MPDDVPPDRRPRAAFFSKEQRVRALCGSVTILAVGLGGPAWAAGHRGQAAPGAAAVAVPESLKPWIPWVLHGEGAAAHCTQLAGQDDPRVCAWPARLTLTLDGRGGTFSQEWEVSDASQVALPGDDEHWPGAVRVDGKPAPVIGGDTPLVKLEAGHHLVTGTFAWETLPDALAVPSQTGLLALTVQGRHIAFPHRGDDGVVFLGRQEAPAETDSLDISVARKLTDDNPLLLTTRLQLEVSGKSREVALGRALPDGFDPQSVDSELPLRFETDGRLRLQVRPGSWTITLVARRVVAGAAVTRPVPGGLWKEGDEVWVFEARPDLRLCDVTGAQAIDPAQTTLPSEWKALPAYAMPAGATLTLAQRRRGDGDGARDELRLRRYLWLDFDGGGFTVNDKISGHFGGAWRLEAAPSTRLGRVSMDGHDQFITRRGDGARDGVEIRSGLADITADSRMEGNLSLVPATGFAHDFDGLSAMLAIPPGWRLFHASGADKVTGTWIDRWSLLDFFLLLVVALAVQRLYGWRLGLLALAGIGLTITETDGPGAVWLAVLVGEAIAAVLNGARLRTAAGIYRVAAWTLLAGLVLPYAVSEIRRGVHPASAPPETEPTSLAEFQSRSDTAPAPPPPVPVAASGEGTIGLGGEAREAAVLGLLKNASSAELRRHQEEAKPAPVPSRYTYDPSTVIQTGPGLPGWGWETAALRFNGPVGQDQQLHLYLAPPWLNLVLSLARVALLAALAFSILRRRPRLGGGWRAASAMSGAAVGLLLLLAPAARARAGEAIPPPEMLEELKKRLLAAPDCAPSCGAIPRMALEAAPGALRMALEVSAAAPTAIPLPGRTNEWSPASVRVEGRPATALGRSGDGRLWVALPAGTFRVELEGPLPARDSVQIALPMRPRYVTAKARGWTIDGLHEDGAADDSLRLSRVSAPGAVQADTEGGTPALPPFLSVERTLHLGLRWEVDTVVRRVTPAGTPIVIDVALLPGEAITTPGIRVAHRPAARPAASLSLGPDESSVSWHSTLAESPSVRLRADAASATRWVETWRLDLGPTWHADIAGIPAVHQLDPGGGRVPEWRPWPGEEVRIDVTKPAGAGGQTLTIDAAALVLAPSLRSTRARLALDIRSSRGAQHVITLSEGVELESVTLDGAAQPIRLEGDHRRVVLPIAPGKHSFALAWHEPLSLSALFRAPAVDLGVPATNLDVQIDLSEAPRWVLWAGGPRLGPAVQFWSVVLVLLVLAVALGRTRLTPLRWWDWTLLGLGLSQVPLPAAALVATFLLAVGWRADHRIAGRPLLYDLSQLAFVLLAMASATVLFDAIPKGLVAAPDMRVAGNGSTPSLLHWYQDRVSRTLPRPWMFSAPVMVYRGAMLLWSLWLALASLTWARWLWRCLRADGWWQPLRQVVAPVVSRTPDDFGGG
jgi:hypothetical protein